MTTQIKDDAARRSYWKEQMELAENFMNKMREYPVEECGEKMISLRKAVKAARLTVKFADTQIAKKYDRIFYLREGLVKKFLAIAKELNNRGWFLKVEDCFRTRSMQRDVGLQKIVFDHILERVIWENNGKLPSPELFYKRYTNLSATCPKIGTHTSGSAIDVSVCHAGNLRPLDCGAPYLEMSELTPMETPFVSDEAAETRCEIRSIMEKHGFMAYPFEFWHFSQGDVYYEYLTNSGAPARYGAINFDPSTGEIVPLESPENDLHSMEEIQSNMDAAIARLRKKGLEI